MSPTPGSVACPHCGGENLQGAAFCRACGKALPTGSGPRIVDRGGLASTSAGQKVQSEELQKTLKKATGALLAVAILQAVFGTILVLIASGGSGVPVVTYVVVYGIAAAFFGLYLWARVAPMPAAIVGLGLFVTVHLLDALADPSAIARGIVVKIIIVVVLARAISAGAQYNRLKDAQQ